MIRVLVNKLQQVILEINKKEGVISINPAGLVFCIVEVHKHLPITEFWLFDTWLMEYVGVVRVDKRVYEFSVSSIALNLFLHPKEYTVNLKEGFYYLSEFVLAGKYKEWIKDYEGLILNGIKGENINLNTYLMTHPVFNRG